MLKLTSNVVKSAALVMSINCFNAALADVSTSHSEQNNQPRFISGVVSITQEHGYIRTHNAPTYWKISPFYLPQPTDPSCSLTAATMLINALRIPQVQYANQKLATTNSVAHIVNNAWANDVKQGGTGVDLDQFGLFLTQAMQAYHIPPYTLEVIHATGAKDIATKFHQALLDSEKTGRTFIIINFNQKVISGTESVGHFAPVGAYDAERKRLLIMDPDRELFEPYWAPEHVILKGMETEDTDAHKKRGFVIVKLK